MSRVQAHAEVASSRSAGERRPPRRATQRDGAVARVLALQCRIGNRAVSDLLRSHPGLPDGGSAALRRESRPFFVCRPVPLDAVDAGERRPLGLTTLGPAPPMRLVLAGDRVRLAAAYDPDAHHSVSVAPGEYNVEYVERTADGWKESKVAPRYLNGATEGTGFVRNTYTPGQVYLVRLAISAGEAAKVKRAEEEHLGDFAYAWQESGGLAAQHAARLTGVTDLKRGLVELAASLAVDNRGKYLVPADPTDEAAWIDRIRNVYIHLSDGTGTRDSGNEHDPGPYVLATGMNARNDYASTVDVSPTGPHPGPPSRHHVDPRFSTLEPAADFQARRSLETRAATLPPGTPVAGTGEWKEGFEGPFTEPSTDATEIVMRERILLSALAKSGRVHAIAAGKLWVSLIDPEDAPSLLYISAAADSFVTRPDTS